MNDLKTKLHNVRRRIELALENSGRLADSVALLAVSKRHPADRIRNLHSAGQLQFGENYVQEALQKQQLLGDLDIIWHFIGPLQANKTREVAEHFHWVQSADREKLLHRLSNQRPPSLPPLNVLLQVNIDLEAQKAGARPEEVAKLAQLANHLPGLKLRGLMAIPSIQTSNPTGSSFDRMKQLFEKLRADGFELDTLSMGMSVDLESAIEAGSTMVRIGTDLLGER